MKDKDVMILLGVVGVLYMAKASTTTTSHEERITANGIEFARHNATRYENQTMAQRLYNPEANSAAEKVSPTSHSPKSGLDIELELLFLLPRHLPLLQPDAA